MDCTALKIQLRRCSISKMSLYVFILIVLSAVGVSFAKSAGNASTTSIPKPFFFTENKGQWDDKVLFKCDAGGGLVWFLERDGFTLLATVVDKTLPLASGGTQGGVRDPMDRDLPDMLRRHPPRYPFKGHALKFKFVKEDIPPLLPPNGVRGDNLSPSRAGGRGGVYLPSSAKYFDGKSHISQHFSNNVQDVPPLLPPNGVRGDNLSPSQAGGRGGVYLPASAKYFDGKSHISQPFSNNVQDLPPLVPPAQQGGVYPPFSTKNHSAITPDFIRKGGTKGGHAKYVEGLGELPSLLSPSRAGGRGGVYLLESAKYFDGKSNISQPFSNNVQDIPPLVPPTELGGITFPPRERGGVYLPSSAKYFEGKSNTSQPFSNNVQDVPPLLPPNGVRGDNLSPSQAGGRWGVYLPASAKYFEGLGELPWKNNYFLGNDSTKWAPNCRNFTSVYYKDVWEGIDIEWYESNGKLEFDFIVQPGADPEQIRIAVEGLEGNLALPNAKESHPPLVPPARQGGKAKNDGGIDSTPLPTVSRTVEELNNPSGSPQPKGTEGDISTPPKSHKPDNRTVGELNSPSEPPQPKDVERDKGTPTKSPKPVSRTTDKWGENTPIKSPLVNGWDRISNPTTIMKGENNPPAVRGGFRGGQTVGDELILPTSLGELRTVLPKVYQIDGSGHIIDVPAKFQLIGNNDKRIHPPIAPPFTEGKANVPITVENRIDNNKSNIINIFGVTLPEGYDPAHPLRIDPLIYSTFLGGSGDDYSYGACNDGNGGVFVTGITASNNFPTTPGAYNRSYSGNYDCFVTHLNSNGTQLLYSTYLGNLQYVGGTAIVNDGSGGVIVTGYNGGWEELSYDCFVARLNSTGSQLIYYVFIGGSGEDYGYDLVNDGSGGVFVTGETGSFDFPTTEGTYDTTYNGGDCFVFHLNSAGQLIYSTYLGGSSEDYGYALVNDGSGCVFVCGTTWSSNFPTTTGAYDTSSNGGYDCFITKLNNTGAQLIYSTYLGGSSDDRVFDIDIDDNEDAIIIGFTNSSNYPTTVGTYDTSYSGGGDCFATKLNSTGTQLIYSTYFGGSGFEVGFSVISDGSDGVIMTGQTTSTDFPVTVGAYDTSSNGGYDCFVTRLNFNDSQLIYSTYLGGASDDRGLAITRGADSCVIVTGMTESPTFPTTSSAFDTSYNGGQDGDCFVTRLNFEPDTTNSTLEIEITPFAYFLSQNYPNPFNSSTTIVYSLPKGNKIEMKLFNILGHEVATILNQFQSAGNYQVTFDGSYLTSGTYFLQMKSGDFTQVRKILMMK